MIDRRYMIIPRLITVGKEQKNGKTDKETKSIPPIKSRLTS